MEEERNHIREEMGLRQDEAGTSCTSSRVVQGGPDTIHDRTRSNVCRQKISSIGNRTQRVLASLGLEPLIKVLPLTGPPSNRST